MKHIPAFYKALRKDVEPFKLLWVKAMVFDLYQSSADNLIREEFIFSPLQKSRLEISVYI